MILNEVLTPVPDGVNNVFTLSQTPDSSGIELYQDGIRLQPGRHYTLSVATVTFQAGWTPQANAALLADYQPALISTGTDLTSLANVKGYLNIPLGNTQSDTILSRLITAMSKWFENSCNRKILRTTYSETFNGDDPRIVMKSYLSPWRAAASWGGLLVGSKGHAITLRNFPVLAINSVTIDGGDGSGALTPVPQATNLGQATQTDGWTLHDDTGKVELVGYRFSLGVQNCVISYDAGFATVPADVEQAVIELVSWRFRERDTLRQISKTIGGGETVMFDRASAPQSVRDTIETYKLWPVKV